MSVVRGAGAAALVVALAAACTEKAPLAQREQGVEPAVAPIGPEVVGTEYHAVELDQSALPRNINAQITATAETVFFYGGFSEGEDHMGELARGDGALLDVSSGELTPTRPWPYEDPPFGPGVVAIDDRFLVVGTPCAALIPDDGPPDCPGGVRAAVLDPATGRWEAVPAPSDQLDISTDGFGEANALGAAEGLAYFVHQDGTNSMEASIFAFDPRSSTWRDLGPFQSSFEEYEAVHCATATGLVRGRVSDEGWPVADRLDLESREWRSPDGTTVEAPKPLAVGDAIGGSSADPPRPRLRCAGNQLLATVTDDGAQTLYWFNDGDDIWYEMPPNDQSVGYPTGTVVNGVLLLWSGGSEPVQALSSGTWTAVEGVPEIRGPRIVTSGDDVIVVGREEETAPDGPENGPFLAGSLSLEIAST